MCELERYNIIVLGNGGVGKSEITHQFCGYASDGEGCSRKWITVDEKECYLDIMEMPLYDRNLQVMKDVLLLHAEGYVAVYSVINRVSFEDIPRFRAQILRLKERPYVPMVLAGNKCDMDLDRVVSYKQGEVLAESLGVKFLETSAENDKNVNQVFCDLVRDMRTCKTVTKDKQPQRKCGF